MTTVPGAADVSAFGGTAFGGMAAQNVVQVLDAAARALFEVRQALEQTRLQVQAVRDDTAWQADAVRAYRQKTQTWDAATAAIITRLADEEYEVRRLRDTAWMQAAGG